MTGAPATDRREVAGRAPAGGGSDLSLGAAVLGGRFVAAAPLDDPDDEARLYSGFDRESGRPVRIRALPAERVPAGERLRLEHQTALLRDLRSRHLVAPIACARDGDQLLIVVPEPGVETLARALASARAGAHERWSFDDVLAIARGVLAGLADLHAEGALHLDLRPERVLVEAAARPPSARLLLFGPALAPPAGAEPSALPGRAVRYMAPEQSGLIARSVDERADLFAAGALIYECATGRPPFDGASLGEALRQHLRAPPPLARLRPGAPAALDALVARLLHDDPRGRYPSAAAALADLEAIERALAAREGDADPTDVGGDRAPGRARSLAPPAFIGRRRELARLERALDAAADGRGGLVAVHAAAGVGKSRLLDEVARRAARRGLLALAGGSGEAGSRRPLCGLDGVVAALAASARADPVLGERVRGRLAPVAPTLLALAPALAPVLEPAGAPPAPAAGACAEEIAPDAEVRGFAEERALAALTALLEATALAPGGAVLLLDDCQWADELTLALVARWPQRAAQADRAPLVVAAWRTDDAGPDAPGAAPGWPSSSAALAALSEVDRIALAPLGDDDAERVIESMAGPVPAEVVHVVGRLAEGNPFLIQSVLEGLVEGRALVPGPLGWRLDGERLEDAQTSRRAAHALERRLDQLPASAQRLLAAGAVLGRRFELDGAARMAGLDRASALEAARESRRRHLLLGAGGGGGGGGGGLAGAGGAGGAGESCAFAHDLLREAFIARTPADALRALHRHAADRLEESGPGERAFELAHHLAAAGEAARAFPHALAAADEARRRTAFRSAAALYRLAADSAEAAGAPRALRARIASDLGDALLLSGAYDDAERALAAARALAEGPRERAAVEAKAGELLLRRGSKAAVGPLVLALTLLGRRPPRTLLGILAGFAVEWLRQALHLLFPRWLVVGERPRAGASDGDARRGERRGERGDERGYATEAAEHASAPAASATTARGTTASATAGANATAATSATAAANATPAAHATAAAAAPAAAGAPGGAPDLEPDPVRLYYQLGSAWFFAGSAVRSTWAMLKALHLAERAPPGPRRAQCLAAWAIGLTTVPAYWLARRYAERAVRLQEAEPGAWMTGVVRYAHAIVLYGAGRFREALGALEHARAPLERSGDAWHLRDARCMEGHCLYALGEVGAAAERMALAYAEARAAGEAQIAAKLYEAWSRASPGAAPPPPFDLDAGADDVTRALIRQGAAVRHLGLGRADEAARVLAEARAIFPGATRTFAAALTPWQTTALRTLYESQPALARGGGGGLARALGRACREALCASRTFGNQRAHALRERGLLEALGGRYGRARRTLERSLAAAARREQRLEEALTRLALARVAKAAGWPEADALARAAASGLAALRASAHAVLVDPEGALAGRAPPAPPALADRFASLLACGRRVATATDEAAVFEAVEDAATALLRGERVLVVACAPSPGALPQDETRGVGATGESRGDRREDAIAAAARVRAHRDGAHGDLAPDERLVRRALAGSLPLVEGAVDGAAAGAVARAAGAPRAASALYAPIVVRGAPRACLYAAHGRLEGFFGEEERRLALFITTLAGAALENAASLAERAQAEREVRRLGEALARGQEDERRRLSLALHDGAGQVLALLAIQLDREASAAGEGARRDELRRRVDLVQGLAQDLRQLSHDLRPATLERLGLSAALRELAEATATAGLPATCAVTPPDLDVPAEVSVHLYRVAQAAIANAFRHAQARHIRLALDGGPDAIVLTIADDGRGAALDRDLDGAGLGIVGMRERAAWLGGRFAIESAPGRGTTVTVTVPRAARA